MAHFRATIANLEAEVNLQRGLAAAAGADLQQLRAESGRLRYETLRTALPVFRVCRLDSQKERQREREREREGERDLTSGRVCHLDRRKERQTHTQRERERERERKGERYI